MRIAICLSGQPRTWRHTHAGMRTYFADHEVDVFFHTWDEVEPSELDALLETYRPTAFKVEGRPAMLDEKRTMAARFPKFPPFTVFDMFYSMAASIRLALTAHQIRSYDLICRSRFDMAYDGVWDGEAPAPRVILVPFGANQLDYWCNDQFAIGDAASMQAYAGMSAWLPFGLRTLPGEMFLPEIALMRYLTSACRIKPERRAFSVALMRESQIGRPFADMRDDPMFLASKHEDWEAIAAANGLQGEGCELDFQHVGRLPLQLDRWLMAKPTEARDAVLSQAWPQRIVAIDGLIRAEIASQTSDDGRYRLIRLICAALAHRMAPNESMSPESFVIHALSANCIDMRRAQSWVQEEPGRVEKVAAALANAPTLGVALQSAPPFEQEPMRGWRYE